MLLAKSTLASSTLASGVGTTFFELSESTALVSAISNINLGIIVQEALAYTSTLSTDPQVINSNYTETMALTSALISTLGVALTESTDVGDSLESIVGFLTRVTEAVATQMGITSSQVLTASIASALAVLGTLSVVNQDINLVETSTVTGLTQGYLQFVLALSSTLAATATDSPKYQAVGVVTSSIGTTTSLASALAVSGNITEQLNIELLLNLGNNSFVGWVVNSEGSFPASKYTNWPFNSYAELGNVVYAMSDTGIYKLTGDTDAGSPIAAHILTGKTDFGSNLEKNVPDVQIGYSSDGTLRLHAIVYDWDSQQQEEYWYEMQPIDAPTPITNDVYLGRGLISNYWQFRLVNVAGSDFEIDSIRFYPVALSRRL